MSHKTEVLHFLESQRDFPDFISSFKGFTTIKPFANKVPDLTVANCLVVTRYETWNIVCVKFDKEIFFETLLTV